MPLLADERLANHASHRCVQLITTSVSICLGGGALVSAESQMVATSLPSFLVFSPPAEILTCSDPPLLLPKASHT